MATQWTEAQKIAINTKNKTLLLSAAAGSGKTSTLTERIIRSITDPDSPADISKMLIVTFTMNEYAALLSIVSRNDKDAFVTIHPAHEINGEGFSRFFEELHRLYPSVGVCGDVGNPLFVDAAPEAIFLKHAKDIKHVHLKDYAVADAPFEKGTFYPTLGGRYLQTAVLGEGAVALDACVAALRQVGYTGAFSLETSGEDEILSRSIAAADALLKTT